MENRGTYIEIEDSCSRIMSNENIYQLFTEFDLSKPMTVEIQYEENDEEIFSSDNFTKHITTTGYNDICIDTEIDSSEITGWMNVTSKNRKNNTTGNDHRIIGDQTYHFVNQIEKNIIRGDNVKVTSPTERDNSTIKTSDKCLNVLSETLATTLMKVIIMSRSSNKFTKMKYNLYRNSYSTIILLNKLSLEDKNKIIKIVVERTFKFTKDFGVTSTHTEIKMLLLDMSEWAKIENSKTISDGQLSKSTVNAELNNKINETESVGDQIQGNICIYKHGPPENEISISIDAITLRTSVPESVTKSLALNYDLNLNSTSPTDDEHNSNTSTVKKPLNTTVTEQFNAKRHCSQGIQSYSKTIKTGYASHKAGNPNVAQFSPRPTLAIRNDASTWAVPNYNNFNAPPRAQIPRLPVNRTTSWKNPQIAPQNYHYRTPPTYQASYFQQNNNNSSEGGATYNIPIGSSPPTLPHSQSPPYQGARLAHEQLTPRYWMDSQQITDYPQTLFASNQQTQQYVVPNMHNAQIPVSGNVWNTNSNFKAASPQQKRTLPSIPSFNSPNPSTVDSICQICGENAKTKCAYRHLLLQQN